jgi:fimbrial chaperone protein
MQVINPLSDRWRQLGWRPLAALVLFAFCSALDPAAAQGLSVSPINVLMNPGQLAAVVDLGNRSDRDISFQVRAYAWRQTEVDDPLTPTEELAASPPLGTIAPNGAQVIRVVLRHPPQGREAAYRILIDELPPPAAAGSVRVAVRLSIPVFAEPPDRVSPQVKWRVSAQGGQAWLAAANDGARHLSLRNIALHAPDGRNLQVETRLPPHLLPGGARRWPILARGAPLRPGTVLRLTADTDIGVVDERVRVDAVP